MGFNPSLGGISNASDVALSSPQDAQVLTYDEAAQKWKNAKLKEYIIDVTKFGLKGDGTTDNTQAFNTLIDNLPTVGAGAFQTLYFPSGKYNLSDGYVFEKSVTIRGDGESATYIIRTTSSTGDLFTFKGNFSTIRDLSIESEDATSGDDIVFDAAYARAQNLYLKYSRGTALRVGKNNHAILHRVDQVIVRAPWGHCAWISVEGTTDGIWSNCDFGTAGRSAVRIDSSAQNMTNIHTWGSGTRNIVDDSGGFLVTSAGNLMSNCQAETNWGHGFFFKDNSTGRSIVTGSKSWANGLSGFAATLYSRLSLVGWLAYDNGLRNSNGQEVDDVYAGVRNEGSTYMSVTSGRSLDTLGARTVDAPSPVMSRGAYATQIYDYIEITNGTGPHSGINTGNYYGRTDGVVLASGGSGTWSGNNSLNTPPTLASSSTLPVRANHEVVLVSGSATITTISQGRTGQRVMLKFLSTASVSSSATLKLSQPFTGSANAYLELLYDGDRWVEVSRG